MQTISIIIPCYNEEKRLPTTLENWQKFLDEWNSKEFKILEIIVIDDGSTDKTSQIANFYKKYLPIKIIKISPNKGKGNAVREGVKNSFGDFIFIYDADSATPVQEIEKLLLQSKNFDIIIGSRTLKNSKAKISVKRKFVGRCFHLFCFLLLPKIKDASCGAKLFKTNVAKKIFEMQKIDRFAFDIEILWLAKKMGFKIKEVGVAWKEIPGSKVNLVKDSTEMFFAVLGLYKKNISNKIKKL